MAAQTVPNVRQSVPPREPVAPPAPPAEQPPSSARVVTRGALEPIPCALADSPVRVNLHAVTFQTPDGGEIAPQLARVLSGVDAGPPGEQPIAVVCQIRDHVDQLLSDAGYVARAQIPAQEIRDGTLKLTIVSARVIEVHVIGDVGRFRGAIESRIAAIKKLDPLNSRQAEHLLLLANDVPGLSMTLNIRSANGRPGDVIGDLTVETRAAQVLANVQNYGSNQLGPVVISARGELYGLAGLADRAFIAYSNSTDWDEIHVLQGGYDLALGNGGPRLGAQISYALSNPDIEQLDLRSRSVIGTIQLSMPLVRTLNTTLGTSGGFEILEQRTRIAQGNTQFPFTRDRLRVLFFQLDGTTRILSSGDASGRPRELARFTGWAQVRQGIDVFDASKRGQVIDNYSPSRLDGDPLATELRGEVTAEVRPVAGVTLAGQAFGQWSSAPLLNLEEFSLGNLTYGRGYDPGSNGGDRAVALRFEPRVGLPITHVVDFDLMGFFDWVHLWNTDLNSTEKDRVIRSIGGGIRAFQSQRFVLDILYAHPFDKALTTDSHRPSDRVLVSFTTQLYPWRRR